MGVSNWTCSSSGSSVNNNNNGSSIPRLVFRKGCTLAREKERTLSLGRSGWRVALVVAHLPRAGCCVVVGPASLHVLRRWHLFQPPPAPPILNTHFSPQFDIYNRLNFAPAMSINTVSLKPFSDQKPGTYVSHPSPELSAGLAAPALPARGHVFSLLHMAPHLTLEIASHPSISLYLLNWPLKRRPCARRW